MTDRKNQVDKTEEKGKRDRQYRVWPLPLVIAIDILLVGVGLVVFALFHHVLPRDVGIAGLALPSMTTERTMESASPSPSATTDPLSGQTEPSFVFPSLSPGATPTTAATTTQPTAPLAEGLFAEKFRDKFTAGEVEKTDTSYKSAHVNVSVEKVSTGKVAYTVIDIYVIDPAYLRTAFAAGKYARGVSATVLEMATDNQAIAAISGDYYGIRDRGIVIRNGVLYREKLYRDVLIMNHDGSMATFTAAEFDIKTVLEQGAWQGWSFGPMLLKDGQPMTSFNSDVNVANPRGAIGYYEPGHYCFVLVDGRQPGYSNGMTTRQLSQLFYDLGCKVAYNLDGGQSAVVTFMDSVANKPYKGGREISDIIYVADGLPED